MGGKAAMSMAITPIPSKRDASKHFEEEDESKEGGWTHTEWHDVEKVHGELQAPSQQGKMLAGMLTPCTKRSPGADHPSSEEKEQQSDTRCLDSVVSGKRQRKSTAFFSAQKMVGQVYVSSNARDESEKWDDFEAPKKKKGTGCPSKSDSSSHSAQHPEDESWLLEVREEWKSEGQAGFRLYEEERKEACRSTIGEAPSQGDMFRAKAWVMEEGASLVGVNGRLLTPETGKFRSWRVPEDSVMVSVNVKRCVRPNSSADKSRRGRTCVMVVGEAQALAHGYEVLLAARTTGAKEQNGVELLGGRDEERESEEVQSNAVQGRRNALEGPSVGGIGARVSNVASAGSGGGVKAGVCVEVGPGVCRSSGEEEDVFIVDVQRGEAKPSSNEAWKAIFARPAKHAIRPKGAAMTGNPSEVSFGQSKVKPCSPTSSTSSQPTLLSQACTQAAQTGVKEWYGLKAQQAAHHELPQYSMYGKNQVAYAAALQGGTVAPHAAGAQDAFAHYSMYTLSAALAPLSAMPPPGLAQLNNSTADTATSAGSAQVTPGSIQATVDSPSGGISINYSLAPTTNHSLAHLTVAAPSITPGMHQGAIIPSAHYTASACVATAPATPHNPSPQLVPQHADANKMAASAEAPTSSRGWCPPKKKYKKKSKATTSASRALSACPGAAAGADCDAPGDGGLDKVADVVLILSDDEGGCADLSGADGQPKEAEGQQAEPLLSGTVETHKGDELFELLLFFISTGNLGGGQSVFQVQGPGRRLLIKACVAFGLDGRMNMDSADRNGLVLSLAENRDNKVRVVLTELGMCQEAKLWMSGELVNESMPEEDFMRVKSTLDVVRSEAKRFREQAVSVLKTCQGKFSFFCSVCGRRFTFPVLSLLNHASVHSV